MSVTRSFLTSQGLPEGSDTAAPTSEKRFPDGAQYRVEIPSVEGVGVLAAVVAEAERRNVPLHRISQGSGGMLTTNDELGEMVRVASERSIELSLFIRPLSGWGIGVAGAKPLGGTSAQACGIDQLDHTLQDLVRITNAGIRNALVTDLGMLDIAAQLRRQGDLPADLRFKGGLQIGFANPASIRVGERLGLDSYNVPIDLTVAQLAEIRATVDLPLDVYIEAPDNMGGAVRHYEIAEIVRVAAPVYLKFGLRNAPDIYPSGAHLEQTAVAMGVERVRRAQIGLEILERTSPDATGSKTGAPDLAIPQPISV